MVRTRRRIPNTKWYDSLNWNRKSIENATQQIDIRFTLLRHSLFNIFFGIDFSSLFLFLGSDLTSVQLFTLFSVRRWQWVDKVKWHKKKKKKKRRNVENEYEIKWVGSWISEKPAKHSKCTPDANEVSDSTGADE